MKLYHFTSSGHMKTVVTQGLTKGRIPWMIDPRTGRVGMLRGNSADPDDCWQWLTESPDWVQDWDEGTCPPCPPYPRTQCRLTIDFSGPELSRLYRWTDFCRVNPTEFSRDSFTIPSHRHWFVYHGRIFPRQFIANERNPNPCFRTPAFE